MNTSGFLTRTRKFNADLKKHISSSKRYHLVLSAVHMVYRLVNSTYTLKELTLRLTRLLCQFVRASSASVYLIHPSKKNITVCASFDNQINIWRNKPRELRDVGEDVLRSPGRLRLERRLHRPALVADDYLGAIFVRRGASEEPFNDFDYEMLSVFAEQVVTAMKNLELHQEHEKIMLGSIAAIGRLLEKQPFLGPTHTPAYMEIVKALGSFLRVNSEGLKSWNMPASCMTLASLICRVIF